MFCGKICSFVRPSRLHILCSTQSFSNHFSNQNTTLKEKPQEERLKVHPDMLFFSFFKTLVDQEVVVELKNDIEIKGTLRSVDQFLNLKLDNISTVNESKYPHLQAVKTLFVRGSTVRYVHLNATSVDCTLLQDASRRGMFYEISHSTSSLLTSQRLWSRLVNKGRRTSSEKLVPPHVYYITVLIPIKEKKLDM